MDTTIPSTTEPASETDTDVGQARNGDRRSFDRLVLRYQDMIVSLCVHLVGNRAEGEDAAQDAFVKAFQQLGSFEGEGRFSTWLYRIAVNVCRNRRKSFWHKLFRRSVATGIPNIDDDTKEMIEIIDSSPLPGQELERKELRDEIKRAICLLPHRYRELIILRDIRQHRYDEIATIIGVPEGTIKSGIARARLALQVELKGLIDDF